MNFCIFFFLPKILYHFLFDITFGHRHIELDLQITRNSRVLILGDCFQQWTYAALSPQGELAMHNA